jgi:tetratricopeptide (TPR) repeat protein
MLKKYLIVVILLGMIFLIGCSKSSTSHNPYENYSDQELLDSGWDNFTNNNFEQSLEFFEEVINRNTMLAEANNGLGWSYAKLDSLGKALNSFDDALNANPVDQTKDDCMAGKCFVKDAQNQAQDCLDYSAEISNSWQFEYDQNLNYNDIVVLRAASFYSLANFPASLIEIQKIDSNFDADVSTAEGRILLAEKIESLRN